MNYIRHLNAFFAHAKNDQNLTAAHVSLYMAMFQYWNFNRFQNPFPIQRETMMQLSKIGSKNTYHKCIRDLHLAKYILYHTQVAKFKHIKISMTRLDKLDEQTNANQLDIFNQKNDELSCPENDTDSVPHLTAMRPINDTVLVPNMGRNYIKQNNEHINSVQKTPTKIFDKNAKISNAINGFIRVSNTVLLKHPLKSEIEIFFQENNYPETEAAKFYYYNHGKGWMLADKIPIKDWQSLAHKWMLNENPKNKSNKKNNHQLNNDKNYSEPL